MILIESASTSLISLKRLIQRCNIQFFEGVNNGTLSGLRQILVTESTSKVIKIVFLFHLKNYFCSQGIKIFVLIFFVMLKNGLIK